MSDALIPNWDRIRTLTDAQIGEQDRLAAKHARVAGELHLADLRAVYGPSGLTVTPRQGDVLVPRHFTPSFVFSLTGSAAAQCCD